MLHRQRGCWCDEEHDLTECALLNIDHELTVREAEVLAPYELELAREEL